MFCPFKVYFTVNFGLFPFFIALGICVQTDTGWMHAQAIPNRPLDIIPLQFQVFHRIIVHTLEFFGREDADVRDI